MARRPVFTKHERGGFSLNRGLAMARLTGRAIRRYIAIGFLGFLTVGCAATLVSLFTAWRQFDSDLIQSTEEVSGLINRIYEFRKASGEYPRSLAELRPIEGDVGSKHERNYSEDDEDYCATWCWTYFKLRTGDPPVLFRHVHHGRLAYEFASSSGDYYPENADEGWVVSSEGGHRYLRSFFSKNAAQPGRK